MFKIKSLAIKFWLVAAALIVIVLSAMSVLVFNLVKQAQINEMTIKAGYLAKDTIESLIPRLDTFRIHYRIQELRSEKTILYAIVQDANGIIISHTDQRLISEADRSPLFMNLTTSKKVLAQSIIANKVSITDIGIPLEGPSSRVGYVRVGFSNETIDNAMRNVFSKIVVIALLLLLSSLFLTLYIVGIMVKPIEILSGAVSEIGKGNFDVIIPPLDHHDEVGNLTMGVREMVQGLKEKELAKNLLGKYISPKIVENILRERSALGGAKKKVTLVCTDIRDFTALSEECPAETVVAAINQIFSIVVRSTISRDGVIDKFLGDGALCVFGVPDADPDDARRAVAMAKEVLKRVDAHNAERKAQGLFELRLGITIHTGEVISGNIGSEERFEYTVIGDPVNTVSRLQDYCKDLKENIILTENVVNELGGTVRLRFLTKGALRGKKEKLELYTFA